MTAKLINGDYEKEAGKNDLVKCEYFEELLQNVKIALKAKRGEFYPNKDFGSRISEINTEPFCEYAVSYARQALEGIDGVYVKSCSFGENVLTFTLDINSTERQVILELDENI